MARPEGAHYRYEGRGLPRWQALSAAHADGTGYRAYRPVVESRQPYVFFRLHGYGGQPAEPKKPERTRVTWVMCIERNIYIVSRHSGMVRRTRPGISRFRVRAKHAPE